MQKILNQLTEESNMKKKNMLQPHAHKGICPLLSLNHRIIKSYVTFHLIVPWDDLENDVLASYNF